MPVGPYLSPARALMGSSLPPSCLTTRQNSRGAMIMEGFSWRSGKYDVKYGVVRAFFCEIVEIFVPNKLVLPKKVEFWPKNFI